MRIPIFVSCPTDLNPAQQGSRRVVTELLELLQLQPRALGRSDYPTDYPLREVAIIARHCSGGIILGFEQLQVAAGTSKRGTAKEKPVGQSTPLRLPTAWNHLEAGILFGLKLPLLIFREEGISGGVFDEGVTDVFVHNMPRADQTPEEVEALREVFLKWRARVSEHYHRF